MQTIFGNPTETSGNRLAFASRRDLTTAALSAGQRSGTPVSVTPAPPALNHAPNGDKGLVEALSRSQVFLDYERAFTEATGLPVALCPVESWQLPFHGKRNEAKFCALLAGKSSACASCLQVHDRLAAAATHEAHTLNCPAGLCETAVPVRLGERLLAFLKTGQVLRKQPTESQFERAAKLLSEWGIKGSREELREAFFAVRVMPNKQRESVVMLLTIFAQHLSILANQVVVQRQNAEPPVITRAKSFIQEHQTEDLRLGQVAKAVNTSTFHFCKIFKKMAGINFSDYLSRVRIEKSKNLLLNPNLRVSEIAFEVGFQSLTHFNRRFKQIMGHSPSDYRSQVLGN
jgi:AraC-like DNA-binding protein/ligand-binding sensor protein